MMTHFSISKRRLPRALSLSPLLTAFAANVAAQHATTLRAYLTERNLELTFAEDPNWRTVTSSWSLRYNLESAAIVTPTASEDIAAALGCAVEFNIKVVALDSGHSYGVYDLGGTHDGTLIIGIVNLAQTSYDETTALLA